MNRIKNKIALLALAPTFLLAAGCDQLADIGVRQPPPCVINGNTPDCEPPPKPALPITNAP